MSTLYDLLGALPDDDADRVRSAFRKAVKASHPDNNPDDPDAPHKFRRVVRAHGILGDARQRATYDWLLTVANQQRAVDSRRNVLASEVRSFLPNAIAGAAISVVSIGAFLLFGYVSRIDIVPARVQGMSARASALAAAMPTEPLSTVGRAGPTKELDEIAVSTRPDIPEVVKETAAPTLAAATDDTSTIRAIPDVVVKDAIYYRQQGGVAYRSGDLSLALVDFDLAINLAPNFSDAYIDRAIVFRRMGDLKHAFADIAEAKRIDELGRNQAALLKPKQASPQP